MLKLQRNLYRVDKIVDRYLTKMAKKAISYFVLFTTDAMQISRHVTLPEGNIVIVLAFNYYLFTLPHI